MSAEEDEREREEEFKYILYDLYPSCRKPRPA